MLERGYVGRAEVQAGGAIEVLVDDVGGGATERTWYDGLGYARVSPVTDAPPPAVEDGGPRPRKSVRTEGRAGAGDVRR